MPNVYTLHHGENLTYLRDLVAHQPSSIDLLLWDPPYNTGSQDLGYQDKLPREVWLKTIQARVEIGHRLLKSSGCLALFIGHHELFYVGALLDNIFGEKNRIALITWECTHSPKNDSKAVSPTSEFILIYAKHREQCYANRLPRTAKMNSRFKNPDRDPKGPWKQDNINAASGTPNYRYGIENPITHVLHYPASGGFWRYPKEKLIPHLIKWGVPYEIRDGNICVVKNTPRKPAQQKHVDGPWPIIYFGDKGTGRPVIKRYQLDLTRGQTLGTVWSHTLAGSNRKGKELLQKLIQQKNLPIKTVKPLEIYTLLLTLFLPKNGHVLDAYAGSGITGHAVIVLNKQDGGQRFATMIETATPTIKLAQRRLQACNLTA